MFRIFTATELYRNDQFSHLATEGCCNVTVVSWCNHVARGASRNVRIYPLTVLFSFSMVIILFIQGLINNVITMVKVNSTR